MRFRLFEANPIKSEKELISDVKNAKNGNDEDSALKLLLKQWGAADKLSLDRYRNIRRVILQSLKDISFDRENNDFVKYIIKNGSILNPSDDGKVDILKELIQYKLINYDDSQGWWNNRSLYSRDDDEFEYTIKIFNIAGNKEIADKYYNSASDISISDLFNGKNIKESGLHSHSGDTIWNTVEMWADKYSEKKSKDDEYTKKYSIKDLFRYKGIKHPYWNDAVNDLFKILDEEEFNKKILGNNDEVYNRIKNLFNSRDVANHILSKKGLDSFNRGEVSKFIQNEFEDIIKGNDY